MKKVPLPEIALQCSGVTARDERGVQTLNGVELTVHQGRSSASPA